MSELQKVLKYFAMAFAAFLAFTIISGIVTALFAVTGFFSFSNNTSTSTSKVDGTYNYSNVRNIEIDHSIGNLIIKTSDNDDIIVETTNVTNDFTIKQKDNGDLYIHDDQEFFNVLGRINKNKKIVVYLPEDFVAEKFDIEAGAGNIQIENLKANKFVLVAGFGNVEGDNIIADSCILESGVGNINLNNVNLTNVDIEGGVGNIKIYGELYGKTIVDSGVGNIKLVLDGDLNDYNINAEKGIGTIKVNGDSISQINSNKNASNVMDIKGGVGNIDIIID
jgi:DUF4097 and DUF4098 domain-containing protein YvlB